MYITNNDHEALAINRFIIWLASVLMNRAIWLAVYEAGFSRIAHGQYTQFLLPYEAATRAEFQTAKSV